MNKTKFILVLIWSLSASCLLAQNPRKNRKLSNDRIASFYHSDNWDSVLIWCDSLSTEGLDISNHNCEIWMKTAFRRNDLLSAFSCLNYVENTPKQKRLKKLRRSLPDQVRVVKNLRSKYQNEIVDESNSEHRRIAVLEAAEKEGRYFWQIQFDLGQAYLYLEKYTEAGRAFELADSMNPGVIDILTQLSNSYFFSDQYERCIISIDRLLGLGYQDADAYVTKSVCELNLNRFEQALYSIDMALAIHPDSIEFLRHRATCAEHGNLGHVLVETSYDLYRLMPDNIESYEYVAERIHALNDNTNQEKRLRYLTRKHPDVAAYWIFLSRLRNRSSQQEFELAITELDMAIERTSTPLPILLEKADLIFNSKLGLQKDRNLRAAKVYEEASQIDSFNWYIYDRLCRSTMWYDRKAARRYKERALKYMRMKYEQYPFVAEVNYELAKTYDLPDNGYATNHQWIDTILKYYNQSLELGMDSLRVLGDRAWEYQSKGEYELAISDYRWLYYNGSEIMRSNYLFGIANCYSRLRQPQKELETLLLIKEEFPNLNVNRRINSVRGKIN